MLGWKEIEYEVMRDGADNCITVCNMENFDPMGVHTGDSIVVAPTQTLTDKEYQMLRTASLKIIRALGIEGGCNVQFALDPQQLRILRDRGQSPGQPLQRPGLQGHRLPDRPGGRQDRPRPAAGRDPERVTGKTCACFEPALDYFVVKIPRWPFDKFARADRTLGTQMKATGEVMAIDRTFEGALMKAVRSLEIGLVSACSLQEAATSGANGELEDECCPVANRRAAVRRAPKPSAAMTLRGGRTT